MLRRRVLRAIPIVVIAVILATGIVLISLAHWRKGSAALAAAAAVAGLFRLLPEGVVPLLEVRSRTFDVMFALALSAVLGFAALGL